MKGIERCQISFDGDASRVIESSNRKKEALFSILPAAIGTVSYASYHR